MEAEPEITKPKKASPCETQKAFLAFRPIRQQNYENIWRSGPFTVSEK